jgi:hypothetical protein
MKKLFQIETFKTFSEIGKMRMKSEEVGIWKEGIFPISMYCPTVLLIRFTELPAGISSARTASMQASAAYLPNTSL